MRYRGATAFSAMATPCSLCSAVTAGFSAVPESPHEGPRRYRPAARLWAVRRSWIEPGKVREFCRYDVAGSRSFWGETGLNDGAVAPGRYRRMATTNNSSSASDAREIHRLVRSASQQGTPDCYTGKRRWTRFCAGMPLEITEDLATAPANVIMQNVSEGGFAFWSRKGLAPHASFFVREYSAEQDREWLPARVRHCTVGLRGFLVGAEFECDAGDTPVPRPAPNTAAPAPPPSSRTTGGKTT